MDGAAPSSPPGKISSLGGGGQSPFQHAIRLFLVQFPCLVHLRGRAGAPQRRDRTRSEHPLPHGGESAVCFEF